MEHIEYWAVITRDLSSAARRESYYSSTTILSDTLRLDRFSSQIFLPNGLGLYFNKNVIVYSRKSALACAPVFGRMRLVKSFEASLG